mmetsp:Transcript_8614/g.16675  ORF Transcript_8614/g.16675 Transcript_8614/m.16675 type:complete len:155 (+) Transcript_8614:221-685(+)
MRAFEMDADQITQFVAAKSNNMAPGRGFLLCVDRPVVAALQGVPLELEWLDRIKPGVCASKELFRRLFSTRSAVKKAPVILQRLQSLGDDELGKGRLLQALVGTNLFPRNKRKFDGHWDATKRAAQANLLVACPPPLGLEQQQQQQQVVSSKKA